MTLQFYQQVVLRRDLDGQGLKRGDVATLVDLVPHPGEGPTGCVLEVFNALGESIAVVVVPESDVEPLRADEVWSVRQLTLAG